jgi:dihydroorotate dehydrogenase (fumarate)
MVSLENLTVGNAAGTIKHLHEVKRACNSAMTRIKLGSISWDERNGNEEVVPGGVYYFDERTSTSINALGLPNPGMQKYKSILPEMLKVAHGAGKNLRASIAGGTPKEFAKLAYECAQCKVDGIEINLGCPNTYVNEVRKPVFSYHPDMAEEVLYEVKYAIGNLAVPVGVKISPVMPNDSEKRLLRLVNAIVRSGIVSEIVATNTERDQQMTRPDGKPALAFRPSSGGPILHRGGLAGKAIFSKSLPVVRALAQMHLPGVAIIGVGGIFSGEDLLSYLEAGARGFECATAYLQYGERIFSDILSQAAEYNESAEVLYVDH